MDANVSSSTSHLGWGFPRFFANPGATHREGPIRYLGPRYMAKLLLFINRTHAVLRPSFPFVPPRAKQLPY